MEISQVSKALARACRVVTHFHHSSKSSYILKQKQIDLHVVGSRHHYMVELIVLHVKTFASTVSPTVCYLS